MLGENRRQACLLDCFWPAFPIGRTPDASCSAKPYKNMPLPMNSNVHWRVHPLFQIRLGKSWVTNDLFVAVSYVFALKPYMLIIYKKKHKICLCQVKNIKLGVFQIGHCIVDTSWIVVCQKMLNLCGFLAVTKHMFANSIWNTPIPA